MIRKAKGLELMKIVFITHLSTFGSKMFLTLKIMDFESVALTKVVHIYIYICDREHECILFMIENQFVVKMYLYLKCSVELGIRNTKL
jgi:hypothetical protein